MRPIFKKTVLLALIAASTLNSQAQITASWGNTDTRYQLTAEANIEPLTKAEPTAWRGERVNLQLIVTNRGEERIIGYKLSDLESKKGAIIPSSNISAGFVEPVLTDKFTGCGTHDVEAHGRIPIADRISIEESRTFSPNDMRGLWLTISVPSDIPAGTYEGSVEITSLEEKSTTLPYKIKVVNRTLPEPKDWKFHLDLWQNPYAVARVHEVEPWSEAHFQALRPYMERLASAGQKVITATLTDKPWDGQTEDPFGSMVTWIKKADGNWMYDFTIFDKWVEFMYSCGIDREITCFSMIPWRLSFRYYDQATDSHKQMKCAPGEEAYTQFWGGMLKEFEKHLKEKGWLNKTCIAMDERGLSHMMASIKVIKENAPGLKISLAGSYHPEIEADLYDYCIGEEEKHQFTPEIVARRRSEGKISTYYVCCSSQYPNVFTFTAPSDAEFIAPYAIKKGVDGFLRWAYNSWTKDPDNDSRFRAWPAGDTYIIYPNNASSIRWERLVEGIQSFEKYQILMKEAETKKNNGLKKQLQKLVDGIDISRIATSSSKMVQQFKDGLNKM